MARVIWSPTARDDLERLMSYLATEADLNTALKWSSKIRDSIHKLEAFPEIGSPVEELKSGYRERLIGRYRIIYCFDGADCTIRYIVRSERDLGRIVDPEDRS